MEHDLNRIQYIILNILKKNRATEYMRSMSCKEISDIEQDKRVSTIYKHIRILKSHGYVSDGTICILTGLSLPYTKMAEIKEIIDANKGTIKRNLTAQRQNRLTDSFDIFGDIVPVETPKNEKKKSNRDLLF